jgi:hypothetical protein
MCVIRNCIWSVIWNHISPYIVKCVQPWWNTMWPVWHAYRAGQSDRDSCSSRHCVLHCSRTETDGTLTEWQRGTGTVADTVFCTAAGQRQMVHWVTERDRHSSRHCVLHCSRTETDGTLTVWQRGTGTVADTVFCTAAGQRQMVHCLCDREGHAQWQTLFCDAADMLRSSYDGPLKIELNYVSFDGSNYKCAVEWALHVIGPIQKKVQNIDMYGNVIKLFTY